MSSRTHNTSSAASGRVFKSFKSNYSKACKRYIVANPGRVITTDVVASLIGDAWPLSFTPVNIHSGFKKSGICPLNPKEINDQQMAPSKAFHVTEKHLHLEESSCPPHSDSSASASAVQASSSQVAMFQRRYEEGYDVFDPEYVHILAESEPSQECTCCT